MKGRLYGSECGGPRSGKGCAGKGVALALNYIEEFEIFKELGVTFGLYDVLGDTVCGGFAAPLKFANLTYIVTNGELASIMQAMKIVQSVHAVAESGQEGLGIAGIINNQRGVPYEAEIVEDVFRKVKIPVIYHIPRSPLVQEAENLKRTVVQTFPENEQSRHYIELARRIQKNEEKFLLKRNILTRNEVQEIINTHLK